MYEATAEEIIRLFNQWAQGATRSPNRHVALTAPLAPPTMAEATALVPRLEELREVQARRDVDWHGRPVSDRNLAAMAWLWEEWRDGKLHIWNGYRDVWQYPDPFYDGTMGKPMTAG